jgi:hypothetical protein
MDDPDLCQDRMAQFDAYYYDDIHSIDPFIHLSLNFLKLTSIIINVFERAQFLT